MVAEELLITTGRGGLRRRLRSRSGNSSESVSKWPAGRRWRCDPVPVTGPWSSSGVDPAVTWVGHDHRVTTSDTPPPPLSAVMSAVGVHREMLRRHLDAWTVWAGYLSLGGTATFPALASALAGTTELDPQQTYLLVQALNL